METPVHYFERLLAEHGDSPRSLDWSPEGQRTRFRVLAEGGVGDADHRLSVLDVGCGLGHFYRYLCNLRDPLGRGVRADTYLGIDCLPAMIAAASKHEPLANFQTLDALTAPLPPADFVVSSGMLNIEQGNNPDAMRTLLGACFNACRIGAAINMLSVRAPMRREGRHYYEPTWALNEALAVAPRVTLRHDYRDNDFTLYLRKER